MKTSKKTFITFTLLLFCLNTGFSSEFKLTSKPQVMPKGTDGSFGTKGTYVLFGDWPQTIKSENVKIKTSKTKEINGWKCYKGNDGFYYVKQKANPVDLQDLVTTFSDGTVIEKDVEYYFKLEPIKWRVLTDDYQGGKLLVAENVLINSCFNSENLDRKINDKTIQLYDYKYSTIRAYLNGLNGNGYEVEDFGNKGFVNKAFTEKTIQKINTVNVHNVGLEDTEDKVFLLSFEDVTNTDYGFTSAYRETDTSRLREITDYSRATGVWQTLKSKYGSWWLRTPAPYGPPKEPGVKTVYTDGCADTYSLVDRSEEGVVPAIVVSF